VHIPDDKYNFFITLIKSLNFVKFAEKKTKSDGVDTTIFIEDLKYSLHEVEQHEKGKVKLQSAKDFLNEL